MKQKQLRTIVFTFLICMFCTEAIARPITRGEARQHALQFMRQSGDSRRLSPAATDTSGDGSISPYYVFDRAGGAGFVIVSGDDQASEPVLGYCDSGTFDYDQLPPNMREWLDGYAAQLTRLQQSPAVLPARRIATHPKVAQLMSSQWSQGSPYNDECPMYFTLGRSVTGCVATAYAQILYYHRAKMVTETQAAMPAYDTWTQHATYGRLHVEGIAKGAPIDWDGMTDTYGSGSSARAKKAVAQLMHYCGVAVHMDYTNSSSGAQSQEVYDALLKYFGFGSQVRYVSNLSSDEAWDELIYKEVAEGRPVYISGSNSTAGHAFVCDGYDGQRRYHINWGWGGLSDGYYYLSNLTPGEQGIGGSGDGYNAYREVIVGIEPENYSEKTMPFADATARRLCTEAWDSDGDGLLSYGEAAAVTSLGTVLKGSAVKHFTELHYFTSLTAIDDEAFADCQQLTEVQLPAGVKHIGQEAFRNCMRLQTLNLPDALATIGTGAFSGCTTLTDIALPSGVKALEARTFEGCTSLTAMTLPVGVTQVGDQAFSGCTALKDIYLKSMRPGGIALGANVFAGTDMGQATLHIMQGTRQQIDSQPQWAAFGTVKEQRELSRGLFTPLAEGQQVYLYHVGSGRYLTKGEAYGTQAVVASQKPMRFVLSRTASLPEGVYYITSDDTGRDGRYLFRTVTDANVGSGVEATFVDGTSATQAAQWAISNVGDDTYTISIPQGRPRYNAAWRWGVDNAHKSNAAAPTWGVYSDIIYEGHEAECQWRFVAYDADATENFEAAQALEGLIATAQAKGLRCDVEQAVLDRLESTTDELRAAQSSLRKKLKFVDFADRQVRQTCIANFDLDADGELSMAEAAMISELTERLFYATSITAFDEFQHFTAVKNIYGNSFENCRNLKTITLPESIERIYYRAFLGCTSLTSIELPEYVAYIGDNAFNGCTALTTVRVNSYSPQDMEVAANAFQGVDTKAATLLVPAGTKALYEASAVWSNFGNIKEVRTRTQPAFSPVTTGAKGYVMNVATRKLLNKGEAYGTQAVVSRNGLLYEWRATADGTKLYLYSSQAGGDGTLFRTSTDSKVGEGVKACFADGAVTANAYWQIAEVGENVYTLQVPKDDKSYAEGQYLGTDTYHTSAFASPTDGIYWDIDYDSHKHQCQWVFIAEDDMKAAQEQDNVAAQLKMMLQRAEAQGLDVSDEQRVYDDLDSSTDDMQQAIYTLREKMHLVTFADNNARILCIEAWDKDDDGELTWEEAAQVTDLGETFRGKTNIKSLNELRHFTGITNIPEDAFRGMSGLVSVTLPAQVKELGKYAFVGCSALRYLAITNNEGLVPMGSSVVGTQVSIFVPEQLVDAYTQDNQWKKNRITTYTGTPVVTAEPLSRTYGVTRGTMTFSVSGAPIEGEPQLECEELTVSTTPVGTYAIHVLPGTVTTHGLLCVDGMLTVEPSELTVTARSYTRRQWEANPEFEVTFRGFRNRETADVLDVQPIVTCDATPDSPAGEYAINVSGAEATNYTFKYVPGVLTVVAADAISDAVSDSNRKPRLYDMQGRRVEAVRKGVYVAKRRKTLKK